MFVPLSPAWLQPLSRYFAHNAAHHQVSAKYSLFISHGGCPPCPPMLSAAPWSWRQGRWHHAGFGEMFDGGASQRENSVADDLPDLAWVANTPRRRPDYPPLSEETPTPRYPIESTDKNFAPQTYFARSADDSPRITLPFLQANVPTDEVQDVGAGPEGQIHPLA